MSAAPYIPLAKIVDVWGRAEGFLIMTVFDVVSGALLLLVGYLIRRTGRSK